LVKFTGGIHLERLRKTETTVEPGTYKTELQYINPLDIASLNSLIVITTVADTASSNN